MGYDFVNTCSRCDYYVQNRALSPKALTVPRSELSKLWQCTTLHNSGELYHVRCRGSSYRTEKRTSRNSFITNARSGDGGPVSGPKRVRLFSPTPTSASLTTGEAAEVEQSPEEEEGNNTRYICTECAALRATNSLLLDERDRVVYEKMEALKDRDVTIEGRNQAITDMNVAVMERSQAIMDRDASLTRYEELKENYDIEVNRREALQRRVVDLEKRLAEMEEANSKLQRTNSRNEEVVKKCTEKVTQLSARVNTLERIPSRSNVVTIGCSAEPLRYIKVFADKLLPNVDKHERCTALFNIMFEKMKTFRVYVKRKVKEEILPGMRMDICREIKRHYTAWRFLEVMDTSSQSLNQVK